MTELFHVQILRKGSPTRVERWMRENVEARCGVAGVDWKKGGGGSVHSGVSMHLHSWDLPLSACHSFGQGRSPEMPGSTDLPCLSAGPCADLQLCTQGANPCFWSEHTPHMSLLLSCPHWVPISPWSCLRAVSRSCSDLSKSLRLPAAAGYRVLVALWRTSVVLFPCRGVRFHLGSE